MKFMPTDSSKDRETVPNCPVGDVSYRNGEKLGRFQRSIRDDGRREEKKGFASERGCRKGRGREEKSYLLRLCRRLRRATIVFVLTKGLHLRAPRKNEEDGGATAMAAAKTKEVLPLSSSPSPASEKQRRLQGRAPSLLLVEGKLPSAGSSGLRWCSIGPP